MDFFDTIAGREFVERVMTALEDIAESLEVIADDIIKRSEQAKESDQLLFFYT